MIRTARVALVAAAAVFLLDSIASPLQRRKKKQEEEVTQTLEVPPDPPLVLSAETARLTFSAAPLSPKGLLSQQTRDGLKALISGARGSQFVKIRAYVAGTGDLRRVQSILSDVFTDKHLSLPVLSVVQVGALPLEGAQVQLEATLLDRKKVNPSGILFTAVQAASPREAFGQISDSLSQAGVAPADLLRLTCAVTGAPMIQESRDLALARFPKALFVVVQSMRLATEPAAACDATVRLPNPVEQGVRFFPSAVAVSAPKLAFAGSQLAFRYQEADARLAFQRLEKTLQSAGSSLKQAVVLNVYPLSPQLADLVRKVRPDFLDSAHPPAGYSLPFEGLPSMDASFGLEAIALAGPGS